MGKFFLVLFLSATAFAAPGIKVRSLVPLEDSDPYEGHLFHENTLWVGRNRGPQAVNLYRVEAYSADGTKLLGTAKLTHTINQLAPLGKKAVAVGKAYQDQGGWFTYYTTLEMKNGKLVSKTATLPDGIQTEYFAGREGALFFNEAGSRAVYRLGGFGAKALPFEISGPGKMALAGDSLFIVERKSFYQGDENLVRFDLKTNTGERLFAGNRNMLSNLAVLSGTKQVAVTETGADRVHVFDAATGKARHEITVADGPAAVAGLGKCVLTLSYFAKTLHVHDVSGATAVAVDTWDLSELGEDVKNLRVMDVDPATGRVFLRAYWRPEHAGAVTGVWSVEQESSKTFSACK